jgi:hypothetical protein
LGPDHADIAVSLNTRSSIARRSPSISVQWRRLSAPWDRIILAWRCYWRTMPLCSGRRNAIPSLQPYKRAPSLSARTMPSKPQHSDARLTLCPGGQGRGRVQGRCEVVARQA